MPGKWASVFFMLVLAKKKYIWDTEYRSFDARFSFNLQCICLVFLPKKRDEKKWKANLIKVADIYDIINISNVSVGTGENILGKLQL